MKTRQKMKNRLQSYNINRTRLKHGPKYTKYKMCLKIKMVLSNTKARFKVQFMKKLSNTEAELKKSVAYEKKACNLFFISTALTGMLKYQYFRVCCLQQQFVPNSIDF